MRQRQGRASAIHGSTAMPEVQPHIEPLLVSVKEARRLLANCSNNRFWQLAKAGAFELVGSDHKRFVTTESLKRYVANMPRRADQPAA
jgi:hypothetical protein